MDITKGELIEQLVEKKRYTKGGAKMLIEDFTEIILDNIREGNSVSLRGFGCFDIVNRKERKTVSMQTGETVIIPEHHHAKFFPGKDMKFAVKMWESDPDRKV